MHSVEQLVCHWFYSAGHKVLVRKLNEYEAVNAQIENRIANGYSPTPEQVAHTNRLRSQIKTAEAFVRVPLEILHEETRNG